MATDDWKRWCRGQEGLSVDGNGIVVTFVGGRHQRVYVDDVDGALELTGFVARQAALQSVPDAPLRAWERNRTTHLVGFRVDRKGRLVGEAWVPKPGLGADEFLYYVQRVAEECDRFEYILTGRDVE